MTRLSLTPAEREALVNTGRVEVLRPIEGNPKGVTILKDGRAAVTYTEWDFANVKVPLPCPGEDFDVGVVESVDVVNRGGWFWSAVVTKTENG